MKAVKKGFALMLACIMILTLFTACSTSEKNAAENSPTTSSNSTTEESTEPAASPEPTAPPEPVKLIFMAPWSTEQVAERFGDELKKKYPHISIEATGKWAETKDLEELFAKGIVPDLLLTTDGFDVLKEKDLLYPLDDDLNMRNFDFSKINKGAMDALRARDPEGQDRLIGIPLEDVATALHYNKDIFDKFGKPYPTDGMTWDEVIELATQVTGERDGVKYRGLATNLLSQSMTQLSANGTDPQTGEPRFSKDPAFAKFFDLVKRVTSIPGNWEKGIAYDFTKKDVAMSLGLIANTIPFYPKDLNYDVVSFPAWEKGGRGPSNLPLSIAISKQSKNKEAALQALEFIMSDEQQIKMSRIGLPVLSSDKAILEQFSADRGGEAANKNIKGIYSLTPAEPALYSPFGPDILLYGTNFVGSQVTPFLESGDDIQTHMRKMDEEYAKIVKEKQNK